MGGHLDPQGRGRVVDMNAEAVPRESGKMGIAAHAPAGEVSGISVVGVDFAGPGVQVHVGP